MEVDEKIEFALSLADRMVEEMLRDSSEPKKDIENLSNELAKIIDFLKVKDFDSGLELSNYLSKSPMLRSRPQKSYGIINRVLREERDKLPADFILEILGYVRRILIYKSKSMVVSETHLKKRKRR